MIIIENYEIILSERQQEDGVVPILALSFRWADVSSDPSPTWDESSSTCVVRDHGIAITLNHQALWFPLQDQPSEQSLITRALLGDYLAQHDNTLIVVAFDDEGEIVHSLGFTATISNHAQKITR